MVFAAGALSPFEARKEHGFASKIEPWPWSCEWKPQWITSSFPLPRGVDI